MTKVFLLSALTVLVFSSCQKQPKADFTMSKSECYLGESVTLTSTSTDASSLKWTFDNVSTSTGSSANYTPSSTGFKVIKLEGLSKNGKKTDDVTKTLTVKNQNEAFKGNYIGNGNSGCEIPNLLIETSGENQIKFDLDGTGGYVYAIVNSTKSATLISNSSFYVESDGSTLSITGGSVSLNGNSLTLTINFSYYDATSGSSTSSSCTSAFNK